MKRKKSLNIFGKKHNYEYLSMPEDVYGEFLAHNSKILISKDLKGEELKQTILHEELHAVFYRMGWTQAIDYQLEEPIVDTIATFIVENYKITPK